MAKTSPSEFQAFTSQSRLRGLWGALKGFRLVYGSAMLSLAVATIARTGIFLLLGYLVDQVLPRPDLLTVLPIVAGVLLVLALVQGSFSFLSGKLAAQTAEGITVRLRNFLYDHIQRMTFAFHDRTPTGDLIQRSTSDVDAVRRFFSDQATGVGRILLLFIVNLIVLLNLNTRLALYSVVVVPIIMIMSVFFFKRVSEVYEKYQEQDGKLSTTLNENLTGVRVVKAFARQEYEKDKFEGDNIEKFRRGKKLLLMHSLFWPIADVLCSGQMLAGYAIGALMTINGELTIGTYVSYMGLVVLLIWPMRELGRVIVQASTGMVSFGRLMEIISQDREPIEHAVYVPAPDHRVRGALEFKHIEFAYERQKRAAGVSDEDGKADAKRRTTNPKQSLGDERQRTEKPVNTAANGKVAASEPNRVEPSNGKVGTSDPKHVEPSSRLGSPLPVGGGAGDASSRNAERGEGSGLRRDDASGVREPEAAQVLHDITFRVEPGQVIALMGPTGSGKTSLVNLLPRFYEYTGGSLTLDGIELRDYARQYLRQHIGIVEQEPFLFSRTLRENITYGVGREVTDEEVYAAARAAAVHDVITSFPEGYQTLVGEKGITLSGGQKQRVTIARTILKNPRILILDDSTSSVDSETEAAIRDALEELMKGRTTFVIAHRIQSVMNADLILVLEHGRIVQRGTHAELLRQDGLYRRIYDLQALIEVQVEKEVESVDAPEVFVHAVERAELLTA